MPTDTLPKRTVFFEERLPFTLFAATLTFSFFHSKYAKYWAFVSPSLSDIV
jgi:hypothetical protein